MAAGAPLTSISTAPQKHFPAYVFDWFIAATLHPDFRGLFDVVIVHDNAAAL